MSLYFCKESHGLCWMVYSWPPSMLIIQLVIWMATSIGQHDFRAATSQLPLTRLTVISYLLLGLQLVLALYQAIGSNSMSNPEIYATLSWIIVWGLQIFVCKRVWATQGSFNKWIYLTWFGAWIYEVAILISRLSTADWNNEEDLGLFIFSLLVIIHFLCVSSLCVLALTLIIAHRRESALYASLQNDEDVEQGNGGQRARPNSFRLIYNRFSTLLPFLWPKDNLRLQFLVFCSFVIVVILRFVNLFIPIALKNVIEALENERMLPVHGGFTGLIGIYVLVKFLSGNVGMLSSMRTLTWISVSQYTTRKISVELFTHLHSLSLRFHVGRKTGEVLRVIDRGTSSIGALLNQIIFSIIPTIADIIIAITYFTIAFDFYFGLLVFLTMLFYIIATVAVTEWRTKFRRQMIELDNDCSAKAVDSLLNFETVKYYNAEVFECHRYDNAIVAYQNADWSSRASLAMLNSAQNLVISLGLLVGCLMCGDLVVKGERNIGDFILFMTYINQLYGPLNHLGAQYRMIQQNFIDMEKMMDLMDNTPEIEDSPNARPLIINSGTVEFQEVSFAYDPRRPLMKNISFTVPSGKTIALVGPSGGGKSTVLKLLFRFYDVQGGRILIDGQDIRQVTQYSLRRNIGVVPQDPVLFNESISYNIEYGKVGSAPEEIEEAAKAAQVHDRIVSFPEGYKTKVGERGLRLSGGEKQRIAIARTVLKNPPILLLDEATSALDNTTERQIQQVFDANFERQTKIVIAHRLSTIMNADLILVIDAGEIVERGTHEELLRLGRPAYEKRMNITPTQSLADNLDMPVVKDEGISGIYYEMWNKEQEAERLSSAGSL